MLECLAIKPDIALPLGRGVVRLRALLAACGAGDGRGGGDPRADAGSGTGSATRRSRPGRQARPEGPEARGHGAPAGPGQGAGAGLRDRLGTSRCRPSARARSSWSRTRTSTRSSPPSRRRSSHTSTSPNLQIIASLDVARRQMELEGYELVGRAIQLAIEIRREDQRAPADLQVLPGRHAGRDDPRRVPEVRLHRLGRAGGR